jgi:spore coat polysaccharide biosynthesis predicted glycosyltransferase SpsG
LVTTLRSRSDPDPLVEWIEDTHPDAVLVDSYLADEVYQRSIREVVPLAVLTDDTRHGVCADLLINGNLYARNLTYEFAGAPPERLLGSKYAPLRGPLRSLARRDPPWREPPQRAIVTLGGSDVTNQTPKVVHSFDGVGVQVDVIIGPGFSAEQERDARAAGDDIDADVSVHRDPDDLAERMFRADLAVCTASSTVYELLALGTPIVCLPVVENQEPIAAALRDKDVATVVRGKPGESELRKAIEGYVSDASLRQRRRTTGRELVDGRGTERIYAAVQDMMEGGTNNVRRN